MISRMVPLAGLVICCAWGCAKPTNVSSGGSEAPVRETFTAVQTALKARDVDQLWKLLDHESQADAERAAKAIQGNIAKADAPEKSAQATALGLPAEQLAGLDGKGFLKTKRFHGKYDELSESKIDKVTVQGDKATVAYTEPDGDKEKVNLVRQDGQWKIALPMPQATQP